MLVGPGIGPFDTDAYLEAAERDEMDPHSF